ncbi:hypothetical protein [Fervidibacillus albus]|uniref:PTS cellobiose transporter subunit IIA n=1 Tax=Fervidibacillus albus TaxID=2980026 RepID=A0A9E8RW29_9BACI|nr:hypothetical protein [Fervidibacillus albus]WAA10126.1 hypothetical protein OE104_01925 [Fervidibacillus albus]
MNDEKRALIEQNRKRQSLKAMSYNRYLLVRYVTALFFFTNIYWFIAMIMSESSLYFVPLILIIVIIMSIAEQVKMYSTPTNRPIYTTFCFFTLFLTNVIFMILTGFSDTFTKLYPFLVEGTRSERMIFIILIIGLLLSGFVLYRLYEIKNMKDKQMKRIKQYEKLINS